MFGIGLFGSAHVVMATSTIFMQSSVSVGFAALEQTVASQTHRASAAFLCISSCRTPEEALK